MYGSGQVNRNLAKRVMITVIMMKIVKYVLIVIVGVFLTFGGARPVPVVSQDGSTTTTHSYGQPFKFHSSTTFTTATGKTRILNNTQYKAGAITALAADIIIWSILIWMVVRMAEQKPVLFWRKRQPTTA